MKSPTPLGCNPTAARLPSQNWRLDLDGDGARLATTDALIHCRIAVGVTHPTVIGGITFATNATHTTLPLIRNYLVTHCGSSLVQ